jgi:excisionase family DNA binding protein
MTQEGEKQIKNEDIKMTETDPEVVAKNNQRVDQGLRILAHMIARAIRKEQEEIRQRESEIAKKESKPEPNISPNSGAIKISAQNVKSENLPPDRLGFTRKEVAKLLGVGISTVYKAIESNQIQCVEFGGRVIIPRKALLEYLDNTGGRTIKIKDRER